MFDKLTYEQAAEAMQASFDAPSPAAAAGRGGKVFVRRSLFYETWLVEVNGIRVYESKNKIKAVGVAEYLRFHAHKL